MRWFGFRVRLTAVDEQSILAEFRAVNLPFLTNFEVADVARALGVTERVQHGNGVEAGESQARVHGELAKVRKVKAGNGRRSRCGEAEICFEKHLATRKPWLGREKE